MNDMARRMVMDRQRRRMDSRRNMDSEMDGAAGYARRAMDYARRAEDYARRAEDYARRNSDMRLSDPIGTEPEFPQEMWDGKQGVKGTGPYGIGGRLYSRGADFGMDGTDFGMDGTHPSGLMKLKKKDFMEWKKNLINADGSHGEHFDAQHIKKVAEQMGIRYDGYDEKDLCMATNMMYSDYCEAIKSIVPPDKEIIVYIKLAQAWLEDPDAPVEGAEKLALYYWCIVQDEE
jgi:hypothetical protein